MGKTSQYLHDSELSNGIFGTHDDNFMCSSDVWHKVIDSQWRIIPIATSI